MRKLSEIFSIAMPVYKDMIEGCKKDPERLNKGNTPGFCSALWGSFLKTNITEEEYKVAEKAIKARLTKEFITYRYLAEMLKAQKKGYTWDHRIAYYEKWIRNLQAKGE